MAGSYTSAVASRVPLLSRPPATSTSPFCSKVAVCSLRAVVIDPVGVQVPVAGLYSSAVARRPLVPPPPATSTSPFCSSVAVKCAADMDPVTVHDPVAALAGPVPVTSVATTSPSRITAAVAARPPRRGRVAPPITIIRVTPLSSSRRRLQSTQGPELRAAPIAPITVTWTRPCHPGASLSHRRARTLPGLLPVRSGEIRGVDEHSDRPPRWRYSTWWDRRSRWASRVTSHLTALHPGPLVLAERVSAVRAGDQADREPVPQPRQVRSATRSPAV